MIHMPAANSTTIGWLRELNQAIQTGDDQSLWRLVDLHADKSEAHFHVAQQIARLAYAVGSETRFSELYLVPVIAQPGSPVLNDRDVWRKADICINEALQSWLPAKTRKTVFAGIQPYDWIGGWKPSILRSHLQSTIPGRHHQVTFITETIDCPPEAPRLGFINMVLTHPRGWLRTPDADTLRDNRFKMVVSYALQMRHGEVPPLVLTPDRVQYAVADGLGLWLHLLNERVGIKGWTAMPIEASPDVVKVTLALDSEEVPLTQFTMRKHQIGLEGVDGVLQMLQALADRLDSPMDAAAPKQERVTVDLT